MTCKINCDTCPLLNKEKENIIFSVLHLTDECNEQCSFCWHKDLNKDNNEMTMEAIEDFLDFFNSTYE